MSKKLVLENGSKIVIVGGGPAGSFFAHFALHLAKEKGIEISVTIFDRRSFTKCGQSGCNMCAGVISESLYEKLKNADIALPDSKVQQVIDGYYFQTQDYGLQLYHPQKEHSPHIFTVFRGGGPINRTEHDNVSFDDYLLHHAESQGAEIVNATVREIAIPQNFGDPVDLVIMKDGIRKNIQADLVVGAFGLNTGIVKRILGRKTDYRPPYSVRACNAELYLGKTFIEKRFGNNIYCFSLGIDSIKFAAFTPKGDYVTVSLIGNADVTKSHLVKLLKHPVVQEYLPDHWKIPRNLCICFPKIPITHAKNPFADRMVIIGDASISRFYKSGIESAFTTAQLAVETAFECGLAGSDFKNDYYKKAKRLLARDNFYGHLIYKINGLVTSGKHLVTPYLQYAKNKKDSRTGARINEALWGMVTGNIQYKEIFFKIANPRFQLALLPTTILAICKSFKASIPDAYQFRQKKKRNLLTKKGLGPLNDNDTAVIIGGGPAGTSCAISLLSQAKERGIKLNVILYESKPFDDITHNECAGVLSPPIKEIIENELGIPFPRHLIESHIRGYDLHIDDEVIKLEGGYDEISYGVLRQKFDRYMLDKAEEAGTEVITSRVTDIEIGTNKVTVYSETKHTRADVIVCAFGLEDGSGQILERESKYLTPRHLLTILAKFHPEEKFVKLGESKEYIHAFLPSLKEIEFGAVTPKEDHYTINIAGAAIHTHSMEKFLKLKEVQKVLPPSFPENIKKLDFHRGCFPISPAKHLFGDRYVAVGDAAGLIRPFKGKGVNSACLMGIKAAEVMMNVGISKTAFKDYFNHFSEIIKDLPYARAVRRTIITAANLGYLSIIIKLAKEDKAMEKALFYSVSGTKSYKKIVTETTSVSLILKTIKALSVLLYNRYFNSKS
ncbi:MAG: hypothetical protein ACUZ8H_04180 [Candidatus Anammoxibacter sp.]